MASPKKDEVIQCEYVYDQKEDVDQQQHSLFTREYSEEDSDKDDTNPQVETRPANDGNPRPPKGKKRNSRYDENMYALPDSDDEAELSNVKLKLKARDALLVTKEKQLFTWKTVACASIFMLLISSAGIAYMALEKNNSPGKTAHKILCNILCWKLYNEVT